MRTPKQCAAACLIFSLALALNACRPAADSPAAGPGPAAPDAAAPEPAATPEPAPAPVDSALPTTDAATMAAASAPPPATVVLASADGEKTGVRVEVTELKRGTGDTVSLKFALINDSDEELNLASHYLGSSLSEDYRSVGGVHLMDPAGKKKYLVVRDTEQDCVCSANVANVKPKTRVNLWAKFPAPPADVQKVGIVVPHFSPMDDVPISQ